MLAVHIQSLNIKILEFPSTAISETWQVNHVSAQLLSDSKSKHAWGRGGGRMFFVLVCFLLTRYDLQKGMPFKDVNWQDCKRSQTGVS